jgi:hypothetical protein
VKRAEFIASLDTSVPVNRSVDQIRQLVERFGAAEFGLQYDPESGRPVAVSFKIRDPHLSGDPVYLPIALRAPYETIRKALLDKYSWPTATTRQKVSEQAERVAWRNLHDFVRASLIGVQTGIMSLGEAFMASLVVTLPTGEAKRLGELAAEGSLIRPGEQGRLMLGRGTP